jgi:hypothetical protein
VIPLKVEGSGDSKIFVVRLRSKLSGQMEERRFAVFKDKTRLRIAPPENMAAFDHKPAK